MINAVFVQIPRSGVVRGVLILNQERLLNLSSTGTFGKYRYMSLDLHLNQGEIETSGLDFHASHFSKNTQTQTHKDNQNFSKTSNQIIPAQTFAVRFSSLFHERKAHISLEEEIAPPGSSS